MFAKNAKVTFCVNGHRFVELDSKQLGALPDRFGFFELEQLLRPHADIKILEVFVAGEALDRKNQEGYPRAVLEQQSVVVIMAEESAPEELKPPQKKQPKRGAKEAKPKMDLEEPEPRFRFDRKAYEDLGLEERVLRGVKSQEDIRERLLWFIRSFNQLRDLEDKNLENNTSVKYSTRDEIFIDIKQRLKKDDVGGYIYQDVKGYDLEELIQIGAELEDKPMVDCR